MTDMNSYTYTLNVTFYQDKSFEIHMPQDILNALLSNHIIDTGKTKGSYGANVANLTVCFKPYAPASAAKALVKEKIEIGAFTKAEKMAKQLRVITNLPNNLSNEQAQRLYEEDARLVAVELGLGLYKPQPMGLTEMKVVA